MAKHQDFQQFTLSGNVGSALKAFTYVSKNGDEKEGQKFRLASNQGESTYWYDVLIFDPRLAGILQSHLRVGRRVLVNGKLRPSVYEGKNGPALSLEIKADAVNFMDIPVENEVNKTAGSDALLLLHAAIHSPNR
jgi:single-stranded DNA-binding protein